MEIPINQSGFVSSQSEVDKGRDGGLGADARQDEEARKHNTGRDKMAYYLD